MDDAMTTAFRPDVQYARSGDVSIAYQVVGDGPSELVLVSFLGNLVWGWEQPLYVETYRRLASLGRLILLDKRGTGLSDRPRDLPTLETRMDDIRAVMDAAGCERAALLGPSAGGQLCALFAATYPERTTALVLHNTPLRGLGPLEFGGKESLELLREARARWGQRDFFVEQMRRIFPTFADDPDFEDWYVAHERLAASPAAGVAFLRMLIETDIRDVLPAIRVPTLLRYHEAFAADARYAAEQIPDSESVSLKTPDLAMHGDETFPDDLERFLTRPRGDSVPDRVLATVLFTDIVGSTARAAELGDAAWGNLLAALYREVRGELARFRGNEIDTAGDGLFATFDGPARAIQCARSLVDATRTLGLELRAGVHTGECELHGDKVRGIAVHTGARVASLAGPGEVLVSSTVKDLVAGSGIEFEDRGSHELKGVPGEWRLYAAR
ncbi:MAG TPA: adenylate/guanylate cyclase domain-containing protein, partial [Gaiellaceae bacterium]|nr:adenylate/guanylate cyclase domain-containing protein [Gaiellaceae bacterium]